MTTIFRDKEEEDTEEATDEPSAVEPVTPASEETTTDTTQVIGHAASVTYTTHK